MNPVKPGNLLPEISKETGYPLPFLEDLTQFAWDYTHKKMTSLENLHIMVPMFGTFHIKGDIVLQKEIDRLAPFVKAHKESPAKTAMRFIRGKLTTETSKKLIVLRDQYIQDLEEKRSIATKRKEIRDESEKNLGT